MAHKDKQIPLPRMPWLASQQYNMRFVLSADNEILWRCDFVPMAMVEAMVEAANKFNHSESVQLG